jgi:hypothetical protein
MPGSMIGLRSLLGATIGAAMLALLAVVPAPHPSHPGNTPELVPWRPSVQARFASALRALGENPQATGFERGTLVAMVRPVAPSAVPSIRIDAAIAASHVLGTCRCRIARYRVVDDALLPDQALIALGHPARQAESLTDLHDARWRMNGASNSAVSSRAADLVAMALRSSSTRVTAVIERDGEIVFSFAYRPATHVAEIWAAPSISLPEVPPPAKLDHPVTPFSGR